MPNLTHRLAELILEDNIVFFIDANLPAGPGQPSPTRRLADVLAKHMDYQGFDRDFPTVAQLFEAKQKRGGLIKTVRQELLRLKNQPAPVYQRLAELLALKKNKVITTQFDRRLETALDQLDKRYVVIMRDIHTPLLDETRITLIKLQGDIEEPDSLIITKADKANLLKQTNDLVYALLATKTPIFLGQSLDGSLFEDFYSQIFNRFKEFSFSPYFIVPPPVDEFTQYNAWREKLPSYIIEQEPAIFLEKLAQTINTKNIFSAPAPRKPALSPPDRPYLALASFTYKEAAIFAGRAAESYSLKNRILAHRLTVLYGESGSGKTSLLQAGVGPLLADEQLSLPLVVCKLTGDSAGNQSLLQQIARSLHETNWPKPPLPAGHTLLQLIRTWQQHLKGPIVLALDQFEQFFLASDLTEQRVQADLDDLRQLVNDTSLNLRLVLVIREDFLGKLEALAGQIPGILDVRFRLERLGQETARLAILEPAKYFKLKWADNLVERLLKELYERDQGGIAPPQLQIVCNYLYETALKSSHRAEVDITLAQYEALGGTAGILDAYLKQAVNDNFPVEQHPAVRELLGALVSVSGGGIKQQLPLVELAQIIPTFDHSRVREILDKLTDLRLLQRYEVQRGLPAGVEPQPAYELTHDYLAKQLFVWLGPEFWDKQRARELVRRALPDWQKERRLLSLIDLRLISEQRYHLHLSPPALEMIYAAAVSHDSHLSTWQDDLPPATRQEILIELLGHPENIVRHRAAIQLQTFPRSQVARALAQTIISDPDETVKEAAARSVAYLARLNKRKTGELIVKPLAAAAQQGNEAAWDALVRMRDETWTVDDFLPPKLRRKIQSRVRQVRWRRNFSTIVNTTVRGAIGGLLGGMAAGGLLFREDVISKPPREVAINILIILVITGAVGAIAASFGSLVKAILATLQDYPHPLRTWFVVTLVSTIALGLGISPLIQQEGERTPQETLMVTLLLGLGLIGVATLPLTMRLLQLGLTTLMGMLLFWLIGLWSLDFDWNAWWLLPLGAVAGMCFFWALGHETTDQIQDQPNPSTA